MKKSVLGMLLVAALVLPVFAAEDSNIDLDVKAGLAITPSIKVEAGGFSESYDTDMAFSLGADMFYYVDPAVALGVGVNNIFNSEIKDVDAKVGFTNIYFAVKPKIALESDTFDSVYFLGQLGYGIVNGDLDKPENGIYWGIGAGVEIMQNFLVELIYSFNYAKASVYDGDEDVEYTADAKYSTLMLNVGYKFCL